MITAQDSLVAAINKHRMPEAVDLLLEQCYIYTIVFRESSQIALKYHNLLHLHSVILWLSASETSSYQTKIIPDVR